MVKFLMVLMAVGLVSGCGTDEKVVPEQQKEIESYLRNIDHEILGGVYRFVPNDTRPEHSTALQIERGDEVTYLFELTLFSSFKSESSNQPRKIIYTNRAEVIETIDENSQLNWSTAPEITTLGSSKMIAGLERGLEGCREGDSVVLIITSDLAYQDKTMGAIPPNTPIVYVLKIENVKK